MLLFVELVCYVAYPFIGVLAWSIVLYQHFKYGKRIRELEEFEIEVRAYMKIRKLI